MAGRFKKVNRIGRGTFGEAWLVTSTCSGRRYVIKEVRVDEMSEEELEKTRTEATILARCKHNSIIRYKEYFMQANPATMCLVMEYADGGDLSEKVKSAKRKGENLPECTVLHWFIQVVFAVQYLHANNILHRDLKTQNIFLTKTNLVKVGDFGIARFLRDKQDLATTAIGTPYYLSPEICQRRPYNHKSDMWAVGCILYELCALRHPFYAENFEDLVVKILRGAFRPLPGSFSNLVKDLISVMLRTNPERRPTADALLILPGLKPYVENYLQQYEDLINNKIKGSSLVDDGVQDNRSPSSKNGLPDVDVDEKIKVFELDKPRANLKSIGPEGGLNQGLNRNDSNDVCGKDVVHSPPLDKKNLPSEGNCDSKAPCIPFKALSQIQRERDSVSSHGDSNASPALFQTPVRKNGSTSSLVYPPAPPNTPVHGKLSGTPPSISLINNLALYSGTSCGSLRSSSPSDKKSSGEECRWDAPDHAPTPYNTANGWNLDSPSSRRRIPSSCLYRKASSSSCSSRHICDSDHLGQFQKDILISGYKKQVLNSPLVLDSSFSKIYSTRRCPSCGKGLNETYIIGKNEYDTSVDSVFEL